MRIAIHVRVACVRARPHTIEGWGRYLTKLARVFACLDY